MRKLNKKGFTLIELLAVIIILGLLMAIAIPSVTRYIEQSRKKTLVSTMGNYISAAVTGMNNDDYKFYTAPTGGTEVDRYSTTTAYLVPVGCIDLEKGGTNPFGKWGPGSYVVIRYVGGDNSSYKYGFQYKIGEAATSNSWMGVTKNTEIDYKKIIQNGTATGVVEQPTAAQLSSTTWDGAVAPTSNAYVQCTTRWGY